MCAQNVHKTHIATKWGISIPVSWIASILNQCACCLLKFRDIIGKHANYLWWNIWYCTLVTKKKHPWNMNVLERLYTSACIPKHVYVIDLFLRIYLYFVLIYECWRLVPAVWREACGVLSLVAMPRQYQRHRQVPRLCHCGGTIGGYWQCHAMKRMHGGVPCPNTAATLGGRRELCPHSPAQDCGLWLCWFDCARHSANRTPRPFHHEGHGW